MKHGLVFRSLSALAFLFLLSASAQAQSFRAYLSSAGSDANPCTLVSPCRLLPAALTAVASGGEIWMLDSANYNSGPVSITKSVTILAIPGALGSLVSLGGNAINITSAVTVTMRNLVIVPYAGGGGTNGIVMTAGTLTLENSVVANMPGDGISVTAGRLVLSSSSVRNNDRGVFVQNGASAIISEATITGNVKGVWVNGDAASTTTADISFSTLSGNALTGLFAVSRVAGGVLKVSMRDGQVARNNDAGVFAQSDAGAAVTLSLTNTAVSNNSSVAVGAYGGGVKLVLSANTVSDNGTGLYNVNGGLIETGGDNMVRNNGTNQTGAVTPVTKL